jgi:hypothetical protein
MALAKPDMPLVSELEIFDERRLPLPGQICRLL